jgi:DNA-binding response OmpR family regulator
MARILIVEDAVDLAELIAKELEQCGFQTTLAATGSQALVCFNAGCPDGIILDWMLPDLDGMAVLHQIRQSSTVPVLMLTARSSTIDRVVGLENGADDYLTKPFNLMELVARVRALLRRSGYVNDLLAADRTAASGRWVFGPLCLDAEAYRAWINDQPLELTRIEFELLHLLLRNPERTFNRFYLLETVWRQSYLEGDRSVDNTVARLRQKLHPYETLIETVRGVGYRLKHEEKG